MQARLLQCRVDWLTVAFQGTLSAGELRTLEAYQQLARSTGTPLEYSVAGSPFRLDTKGAAGKPFRLTNADATILVGLDQHDWCVVISPRAVFLATTPLPVVLATLRALADHFLGGPKRAERVRRLDLCADATGFDFRAEDAEAFVGRARGLVRCETRELSTAEGGRLTGFRFAVGNPISARIYDKTEELRAKYDDEHEKARTERAAYRAAGWDGESAIWRLEFQLMGDALDQLGLRNPEGLEDKLDAVWRYLAGGGAKGGWLRLTEIASATRAHRRRLDPRWAVFQGAEFREAALSAAERVHGRRGGVPPGQALGAVLSCLAASGKLRDVGGMTPERALAEDLFRFAEMVFGEPARVRKYLEQRAAAAAAAATAVGAPPHATGRQDRGLRSDWGPFGQTRAAACNQANLRGR